MAGTYLEPQQIEALMSDYLVVAEAEDGTWYDEGETALSVPHARRIALGIAVPNGYQAVIYKLVYVETVERPIDQPETGN